MSVRGGRCVIVRWGARGLDALTPRCWLRETRDGEPARSALRGRVVVVCDVELRSFVDARHTTSYMETVNLNLS